MAGPWRVSSLAQHWCSQAPTLQEQIRDAKAEVAAWEPDRREAVVLQGPRDAHPPTRECMCAACRPSFDNGANDPSQRHAITRAVSAGSAEWLAEAEWLVEAHGDACADLNETGSVVQMAVTHDALLAHLRKKPGLGNTND